MSEHSASVHSSVVQDTMPPLKHEVPAETTTPPSKLTLPDGGLQAWATVLGSFLIQVCNFGYTSSFGVYQDFYVREYITNSSPSAISWIGSLNAFLLISGGVVAGRLYDRGYFYPLLYGGSLLTVFSLFMLSLAKPNHYYQVFLSQGVGAGLGGGLTYVPSVAITSQYFSKRRALAMTIIASGASIGAIIHPLMLNNTLGKLGFGNSVRASAGLVAGLLLVSCCVMRTRVAGTQQQATGSATVLLKSIATDWAYVAATLGLMIFSIGFYFPQFYLQLDASTHNLNETFSFYSLVILNFSSALGRVIPGFFANQLGVGNMITAATAFSSAVIFGMIGLSTVASVVLIAIFYGFFAGTFVALMGPLMVLLSKDLSEIGIRMGVAFFFSGIGGLIGTPIGGALLTENFIWWRPAVFSGITSIVGSACFGIMLIILHRRKVERAQPASA
ncbi:hypothetical protein VNI00_002923 [Paramarasmius palmivorus]|uniref:Major facilitator superfamily (MFS) profile domain-containing protein n=1 Tax=Paramarasmius palmivorus TaxID=297713 RepID=A0AAW0DV29_9AGAR